MLDCKERVEPYFRNMAKYENDLVIHVRFLDKIFHAAMDDYDVEEKTWVLNELLSYANSEKELQYKLLDLCYAYRINKILGTNIDVPVIFSEDTIIASICSDDLVIPDSMMNYLKSRPELTTLKLKEVLESDKELLELYNVQISKDHFIYRG
ncbi:MAG: hypothetical protein IJ167_00710 [Lachnospiraceae bacterium]|nr:hypothetical protein [Lachnospiraceae bacterium]